MRFLDRNTGFSLLELLVAMAITGVVSVAIFSLFVSQNRTYDVQEQRVALHQNLRVAMEIMQRDLRMAGFDPTVTDNFGITDVRDVNGENSIQFTADIVVPSNGDIDAGETFTYSIFDSPVAAPDGITDLGRDVGGGLQMLGEGVERLGFAYAYADNTGTLVLNAAETAPIWAYDSDNDNFLDRRLDTDNDGDIDLDDAAAGVALVGGVTVSLDRIRAVKIWILGRALQPDLQYQPGNLRYKVGNRNFNPPNDNIRRKVLTSVVKFRNLGL